MVSWGNARVKAFSGFTTPSASRARGAVEGVTERTARCPWRELAGEDNPALPIRHQEKWRPQDKSRSPHVLQKGTVEGWVNPGISGGW
ncbi:MAG TPA: hypothetical protein VG028_15725 [Terriglobia bacterium]|nr:hypothetical protein [Terriglobia bacterium]